MTSDGVPPLIGRGPHKSFGPIPALRGVDIAVGAGEVLTAGQRAVVGSSGQA